MLEIISIVQEVQSFLYKSSLVLCDTNIQFFYSYYKSSVENLERCVRVSN